MNDVVFMEMLNSLGEQSESVPQVALLVLVSIVLSLSDGRRHIAIFSILHNDVQVLRR